MKRIADRPSPSPLIWTPAKEQTPAQDRNDPSMNAAAPNAASGFKAGQKSATAPGLSGRNGGSTLPAPVGGETKTQSSLADITSRPKAVRALAGSLNLSPEQTNRKPRDQARIVNVAGREALAPSRLWLLAHFSQPRYGAKGAQVFNQMIGDRPITPRLLFYVICTLFDLTQTAHAKGEAQRSDQSRRLLDNATILSGTDQMKRLKTSHWSKYARALYDEALARSWMERNRLDPSQLSELPRAQEHDFSYEGLSDWFPDVEPDAPWAGHAERGEENLTQEAGAITDGAVNERPVALPEPERIVLDDRMIDRIMLAWSEKQKASGKQPNGKVVEIATKFLKSASFEATPAAEDRLIQDMVERVGLFLDCKTALFTVIYREKDRTERINTAAGRFVSPRVFEPPTDEAVYTALAAEIPANTEQRRDALNECARLVARILRVRSQAR